ncbi:MAG TPA: hypothetical protein VFK42_04205 [Acidimicrobiales bacterium]|nr:hypothetical protein [Acidimicrobiales bacterium]
MDMTENKQTGEWWATITHAFQAHVREESQFLDEYEKLCESLTDPGTRFLVELILEDERRHHQLFERMSATALGEASGEEATPPPPQLTPEDAARVLPPTERFLAAEKEDRHHLAELRKQLKPARDDTLWELIIELLELDTAKHVRILEYVRDRARDAARGS